MERLIVGISGASGAILGIRLLEALRELSIETHLVISRAAYYTIAHETDYSVKDVIGLASAHYNANNIAAAISSGSFQTNGMVVAPCSMRSLSEIAYGNTTTLLSRAADVVLKERRRLVLLTRETPLHLGHLRAMCLATEQGAIVAPFAPAFYSRPSSIDDLINHSVGRVLDLFELDSGRVKRWQGIGSK